MCTEYFKGGLYGKINKKTNRCLKRDFDSFKTTKSYKPLKNGYFFVNLLLFILRTLSYFDIMYIQGSDKHAYKKN